MELPMDVGGCLTQKTNITPKKEDTDKMVYCWGDVSPEAVVDVEGLDHDTDESIHNDVV